MKHFPYACVWDKVSQIHLATQSLLDHVAKVYIGLYRILIDSVFT